MTQNINPVTSSGLSVNSNKLEKGQTNDDETISKKTPCKGIVTNFEKDTENVNCFMGAASSTPKGNENFSFCMTNLIVCITLCKSVL